MIHYTPGEKMGSSIFLMEAPRKTKYIRRALFECKCGNRYTGNIAAIKREDIKSCGCQRRKALRKLTDKQAKEIRNLIWKEDKTLKYIADIYNVSLSVIFAIKVEKTYKYVA
jgi:hypothetical protein